MSHFSSRPHPSGFCRRILLVFSIADSAPGFVNPECFFWLKENYRKFQNKRIFCKGGGEGEEEKEKKKFLKFHFKLSMACALNLKQSISYTDPSCSLSQLPRHSQSQHLTFPVIGFGDHAHSLQCHSLFADYFFFGLHVRYYSSIWLVKWFNEWSIIQWTHAGASAWLSQLSGMATAADSWKEWKYFFVKSEHIQQNLSETETSDYSWASNNPKWKSEGGEEFCNCRNLF